MTPRPRFAFLLLAALAGCASWTNKPIDKPLLPPLAGSLRSVELDVAFAHIGPEEQGLEEAFWQQFDEQAFSAEQRRPLQANGFRVALLGSQMPDRLLELVHRTASTASQAPDADRIAGEDTPEFNQRRLNLLPGKRGKIVVSPTFPTLSILSVDAENRVRGQLFSSAQCSLNVVAWPEGDGGAKIELIPEIEHGDVKNRWVPVDGALVQQIGRERHAYDAVRVEHKLLPGQMLILGSTPEPCGVGRPFFYSSQPTQRRLLLLIRLAGSSHDDLFQSSKRPAESLTQR